jgi:hypothetical protein
MLAQCNTDPFLQVWYHSAVSAKHDPGNDVQSAHATYGIHPIDRVVRAGTIDAHSVQIPNGGTALGATLHLMSCGIAESQRPAPGRGDAQLKCDRNQ